MHLSQDFAWAVYHECHLLSPYQVASMWWYKEVTCKSKVALYFIQHIIIINLTAMHVIK